MPLMHSVYRGQSIYVNIHHFHLLISFQSCTKNSNRQGNRTAIDFEPADAVLIAQSDENVTAGANSAASGKAFVDSTQPAKLDSSTISKAGSTAMSNLGGILHDSGLSCQAAKLVLQSWR